MSVAQRGTLLFAVVNASATGSLVAAVSGKSIVLVSLHATLAGTTPTMAFRSGASTAISGTFAPTTGSVLNIRGTRLEPVVSTAKGSSLDVVLAGAGVSLQGVISYYLEEGE